MGLLTNEYFPQYLLNLQILHFCQAFLGNFYFESGKASSRERLLVVSSWRWIKLELTYKETHIVALISTKKKFLQPKKNVKWWLTPFFTSRSTRTSALPKVNLKKRIKLLVPFLRDFPFFSFHRKPLTTFVKSMPVPSCRVNEVRWIKWLNVCAHS